MQSLLYDMRALARTVLWSCLAGACCLLAGCDDPQCLKADGTGRERRSDTPRHHCGLTCDLACAFPGVPDEMHRCRYFDDDYDPDTDRCVLRRGWACAPGYHDTDPDTPGCECRGPSADDCEPCGEHDLPHTGVDEDCDLRVDEAVPPGVGPWTLPPNGEAGAVEHTPHLRTAGPFTDGRPTRTSCGDGARACALDRSGRDVACVAAGSGSTCAPVGEVTAALAQGEDDCTDGVDDDGNGVIDDGPGCQTLVAAVARPECHGRTPGPGCPPTYVPLDSRHARLWSSEKPLVALMTYDVLLDNTEATLGQVQRFLAETGRCDNREGANHPLCDDTGDPRLPAGGLDWCVAYEYCQWKGQRLPTELEWLRAHGGTDTAPATGPGCAEGGNTSECEADGPRRVGQPGGHTTKGLDGEATLWDALGNVAEWLFDAHLGPCEPVWADCTGSTPRALYLPLDPALHAPPDDPRRPRLLRGGGWGSEAGAGSTERVQFADPGVEVPHYGVRCAQTWRPVPESSEDLPPVEQVPYDSTVEAKAYAECRDLPRPERLAPRTPPHRLSRAVEACVRGVDDPFLEAFVGPLARGQERLLFSVTDEGGGAAGMALEVGLVPGAEAFWIIDRPPSLTAVEAHCTPLGCRFDRSSDPGYITVPTRSLREPRLELLGITPITGAIPTCLPPTPVGETAWRLNLVLPRALLDDALAGDAARACAALRCVDEAWVDDPACPDRCEGWRLPVDVQLQQLTVP